MTPLTLILAVAALAGLLFFAWSIATAAPEPTAPCHKCCREIPESDLSLLRCGLSRGHFCPQCVEDLMQARTAEETVQT